MNLSKCNWSQNNKTVFILLLRQNLRKDTPSENGWSGERYVKDIFYRRKIESKCGNNFELIPIDTN